MRPPFRRSTACSISWNASSNSSERRRSHSRASSSTSASPRLSTAFAACTRAFRLRRSSGSASRRLGVAHYRLEEIADGVVAAIAIPDGEIVATTRTKELIERRSAEQLAEHKATDFDALVASLPAGPDPGYPGLDRSFEARAQGVRHLAATIAEVGLRPPTRTFEDRLELAPNCELITLGAGHTESDAFLLLADRHVAVVGDLLCVEMHPWMGHGDPDCWIEILVALERLDVNRFVPGHGGVATVEHVRALREHLRAFLAEPESIESLYPDWDFWGDTADRNRAFLRDRAR